MSFEEDQKWEEELLVNNSNRILYAARSSGRFDTIDAVCAITRPSSTYESRSVPSRSALSLYSFIIGAMYKAESTGDNADPWPTPTSACLGSETNVFHVYDVYRSTR